MSREDAPATTLDLANCDREPIHIPGSIQPHGVLLVLDRRTLEILQYAGDASKLLGVPPDAIVGQHPAEIFAPVIAAEIASRLLGNAACGRTTHHRIIPLKASLPLELTCFADSAHGFVELEPVEQDSGPGSSGLDYTVDLLRQQESSEGLESLCQIAARQVRGMTGFDRVCVYRFLHDGSGQVIAEDRDAGCDSYLGLHYPASDVPQQARALYLRNWVRVIPDARYVPSPLVPARQDQPPVDMSDCALRSVSPIHLEYLANMGVTATLTLSLVVNDELWGLIACHHYSPRRVPVALRTACEMYARFLSLQIGCRLELESSLRREAPRKLLGAIAQRIPHTSSIAHELLDGNSNLLDLMPATGVALQMDDTLHVKGQTPPLDFVRGLVDWLGQQGDSILSTHKLGEIYPPAQPFAALASGLLAMTVARDPTYLVMWFRPELARTVRWAGNPDKPVEPSPLGDRLTPRKSFEAWQTETRGQAKPWEQPDFDVVDAFRLWLLEILLVRSDQERREREALYVRQGQLLAELDHRVKNTLANIHSVLLQTSIGAGSIDAFVEDFQKRIQAMAHAHGLLAVTHWEGAALHSLLDEEVAPYLNASASNVRITGPATHLSPTATMAFNMVLHELVTNAAKYGALSTPEGVVRVRWERTPGTGDLLLHWSEQGGPAVTPPSRKGFGTVVFTRLLQYELKGRCTLDYAATGLHAEVLIPRRHLIDPDRKDNTDG